MDKSKVGYIYVLGDGDKIRERVEYFLLSGEFEALADLSQGVTESINAIKSLAVSEMRAEVIMAGGDDILFRVEKTNYQEKQIRQLADFFRERTGNSFSFGVGTTVESAYINLRRAKSSGSGRIVAEGVE